MVDPVKSSKMMPAGPGGPRKGCIDQIITPVICVFFVINFLFFILGIIMLALGGVALFDEDSFIALAEIDSTGALHDIKVSGFMRNLATGFMVGGGILLLIGFLGCVGVSLGISCFIYMYCIIFSLMVVAQLGAFGYAHVSRASLTFRLKSVLEESVYNYEGKADHGIDSGSDYSINHGNATEVTEATESAEGTEKTKGSGLERALDLTQKFFECCGVNGGEDYQRTPWYKSSRRGPGQKVPLSCCKLKDRARNTPQDSLCQTNPINTDNPFTTRGCLPVVMNYVFTNGIIAIIITVVVMALQLLAICYAVVIEKSFSDDDLTAKLTRV